MRRRLWAHCWAWVKWLHRPAHVSYEVTAAAYKKNRKMLPELAQRWMENSSLASYNSLVIFCSHWVVIINTWYLKPENRKFPKLLIHYTVCYHQLFLILIHNTHISFKCWCNKHEMKQATSFVTVPIPDRTKTMINGEWDLTEKEHLRMVRFFNN